MKIQIMFVWVVLGFSLALFCSCSTVGTKFSLPDADKLQLGKLQTSDATNLFGKPTSTGIKTTPDGNYEFYKYDDAKVGPFSISERVLLLEFKDGKLNGYYCWSSFNEDKTKVDLKNVDELKVGIGKLTKDDVLKMAGEPSAKAFCPSMINVFKEKCTKNTEVWGWYMQDKTGFDPAVFNSSELYISFDTSGKVSSVESGETKR